MKPDASANRGLHGEITDNPLLLALLNAGNRLRYGKTEAERQADVTGLRTPGVRDVAYGGPLKMFDPAAAERYTSAYQFGNRFSVPEALQPLVHAISGGGRELMGALGVPGVGEEREELTEAERLGMHRGSASAKSRPSVLGGAAKALLRGLMQEGR
jgi:hypothetical protein